MPKDKATPIDRESSIARAEIVPAMRIAEYVLLRAGCLDAPMLHHDNPVGEAIDLVPVV